MEPRRESPQPPDGREEPQHVADRSEAHDEEAGARVERRETSHRRHMLSAPGFDSLRAPALWSRRFSGDPMPLDSWLLDILVCPVCKTSLSQSEDGAALRCATCRRRYAVTDDAPNMLVEEATVEPEGAGSS
jgi:uncharacterized protein YbaR (Trm112 family)